MITHQSTIRRRAVTRAYSSALLGLLLLAASGYGHAATIDVGGNSVNEGAGSVEVVVSLSARIGTPVSVWFATNRDSAVNGLDYYGTGQLLSFAPGETEKRVSIDVIDDTQIEGVEQFRVRIFRASDSHQIGTALATVTITDNDTPNDPNPNDNDSYGTSDPPNRSGPGWSAVDSYFRKHPRRSGECSQREHDQYWVRGADGKIHPTWHPVIDSSGCAMAHDHGDDPRTSDILAFSGGLPFAMTQGAGGNENVGRHEDHVGHKVVVQNNWFVVEGNPQHGDRPNTDAITRSNIQCDWLSKIHQGSHSTDALANNGHEYLLNIRCSDGVKLRLKQIVSFGPAGKVTNLCSGNQAFATGFDASNPIPVYNYLDGKREYNCIDYFLGEYLPEFKARRLEELWKPDGVVKFPRGGYINFSPYYVIFNPARYMDNTWEARGAENAYISTVNLCFDDAGRNVARSTKPTWCDQVPASVANTPPDQRIAHPDNPMNGTKRVIHPKGLQLDTLNEAGSGDEIRFCTNAFAQNVRVLNAGESCRSNEIEQLVSRSKRGWGFNGSDVNSFTDGNGNLRGAGYLNEWVRDFSGETTIRYPN